MKKSRRHHRTDEDSNGGEDGTSKDISTAQAPEVGGDDEEKGISQSRRKHRHRRKEIDPIKASRRKSRLCIGETLGNLSDDDDEDDDDDGGIANVAANEGNYDDNSNTNDGGVGEVKKRKSKRKQGGRKESIGGTGDKLNSQSASEENSNNSASYIDTCDIEVEIPRNKAEKANTVITNPTNIKKDGIIYQKAHLAKPLPPSKVVQRTQSQTAAQAGLSMQHASPLSKSLQISAPPQQQSSQSTKKRNNNGGDAEKGGKDDCETRKTRSTTMLRAANIRTLGGADDDLSFVPATDTEGGGNVFTAASEYTPNYQSLLTPRTFYVSRLAEKDIATHANAALGPSPSNNGQNGGNACGKCYNEDCSECCWRKYMEYKAISYLQKLEEFYSARSIAIVETEGLPNGSNRSNGSNGSNGSNPNAEKKSNGKKGKRNSTGGVLKLNFGGSSKKGKKGDDDDDDDDSSSSDESSSDDDVSTDVSEYDDDEDDEDDDDDAYVDGFRDAELATNFEDPFNFVRLEDVVEPDDIWEELRTGAPLLTRTLVTEEGVQGSTPGGEDFLRRLRDSFLSGDCAGLGRPRYAVQAGSLNRLVQCLTPEDGHTDPSYVAAFMLTYPRFTSTTVLINKLIARYLAPKQEAPPRRVMVRAGVLAAVGALLLSAPADLSPADTRRLSLLVRRAYADGYEAECAAISEASRAQQLGSSALTEPEMGAPISESVVGNDGFEYPVRLGALTGEGIAKLAEQMCLIDDNLYCNIEPREFLVNWEAPKNMARSRGIREVTRRFNAVSVWTTSVVIQAADARGAVIEALVKLADALRERANYQSLNAVISGLTRGCIAPYVNGAFKKSAAGEAKSKFQELRDLMIGVNWVKEAATKNPPMIPFLGKYQTDIFRIGDTLQDKLQDGQINFKKFSLMYQAIKEALRGKSEKYKFAKVPSLHFYAVALPERMSEEQLENYVPKK